MLSKPSWPWPARSKSGWAQRPQTTSPRYRSVADRVCNQDRLAAAAKLGGCWFSFLSTCIRICHLERPAYLHTRFPSCPGEPNRRSWEYTQLLQHFARVEGKVLNGWRKEVELSTWRVREHRERNLTLFLCSFCLLFSRRLLRYPFPFVLLRVLIIQSINHTWIR